MKYCYACQQDKDEDEFYANKSKKDGLSSACKLCTDAENLRRQRERIDQDPQNQQQVEIDNQLRCHYCGNFKPKIDFHKNKTTRTGYSTKCKKCHKEQYGEHND